jgi:hypothetical protein
MSSFNLEEVLDKNFLEKMKDINPDELLADLTKQLDGMVVSQQQHQEVNKPEQLTVETPVPLSVATEDDKHTSSDEDDKPLSRDEILRRIKARQQSMAKRKHPIIQSRENPMQQQIKKMSEMLNGADAGEVNKMIDGMIGKMAQNSKEKKLMKKRIEKMMESSKK